ncbi:hypothetical protein GPECTOR_3g96 [Gonium pectorale]|uniref:Cyclic nucleotide-binding domain-containing protein n=1 Tax=Gonium pectorale TaxID=33097 RepID=A0A150GZV3_GONPE|nr:hypothetical protein GPECTOR_3g96 [Gonium pectorale]|eukprot:KXZ55447.1 hypothetical protein GPECTOR_3g96 [Gonium pectorale]
MFVFDVLSALPFHETLERTSMGKNSVWFGLLKMPRLFRLIRHLNLLSRSKYVNLVSVARLLMVMLLTTHWTACLWHWLSELVVGWPWVFEVQCPRCSDGPQYVLAFYRCFLLLIGDRPETYNNVERVFAVLLLFIGACFYAIVSSITMLVSNMWSMASRHKQRATMLQDALRYKGADTSLRVKVEQYFNFMASYDHPGPDGVALLSDLPSGLHAEVLSSIFEPMLQKVGSACPVSSVSVQLFAYCEKPFVWRLAQRLRLSLFMRGDVIYELGSVGHEMYMVWRGAVGLIGVDGAMAALFTNGDHFGHVAKRTESAWRQ